MNQPPDRESEVSQQEQMDRYKACIATPCDLDELAKKGAQLASNLVGDIKDSIKAQAGVNPKDLIGMTKPPLSLVPPCFSVYVAMAMKNGAKKYGPYNWRKEKVQSMIYLDAALRHIQAFIDGETNAQDSGVHHLAHAGACLAILLDAFLNDCVKDNRPIPGKVGELIAALTEKKA